MRCRTLLLAVALLAPAASLPAQAPTFISGRVLDDATDEPVVEATVDLLAPGDRVVRRSVTDEAGVFAVSFRGPGTYWLRATRIGLAESRSAPLQLQPGDTLQVILRMNIQAVALPALEVVADRRAHPVARLEGFHLRARQGLGGGFIHREDIERRNPFVLSDMLPEHGIDVERSGRGVRVGLLNRRFSCAPLVYIDGALTTPLFVDAGHPRAIMGAGEAVNMIHPSDVEGVEIYRGPATVPGEFGGYTARCGVIAIWTRAGTE
jgi:hypothetical protein